MDGAGAERKATDVAHRPLLRRAARAGFVAIGLVHLVIAWIAAQLAIGAGSQAADQTGALRAVARTPVGGPVLVVAAAALALLALWFVVDALVTSEGAFDRVKSVGRAIVYGALAWTSIRVLGGFLDDLTRKPGRWAVFAGQFGYIAKGVALAVVGLLFVSAAVHSKPSEAGGLDAALRRLLDQPLGVALLLAVAFGLASFAGYSFVRARYGRL